MRLMLLLVGHKTTLSFSDLVLKAAIRLLEGRAGPNAKSRKIQRTAFTSS